MVDRKVGNTDTAMSVDAFSIRGRSTNVAVAHTAGEKG